MLARESDTARSEGWCFDKRFLDRPIALGHFVLEQVRDSCFLDGFSSSPVHANSTELYYVMNGTGSLLCAGDQLRLQERDIIVCQAPDRWRVENSENYPLRLLGLRFRLSNGARGPVAERFGKLTCEQMELLKDDGTIETMLLGLLRELERPDSMAKTMAESFLQQIVVSVFRARPGQQQAARKPAPINGAKELVYQTVRYMDESMTEIKELNEIADALGYSYSRLSHVFRLEMGVSLQTYWARSRMLRAMKMLQTGNTTITRVAELLHYQSVHSFSKAFKKIAGLSPTEYQELYGRPALAASIHQRRDLS
ncbi:Arabinose operon regulatory protein [Chlamydia abortus]|uniref:Helix-turn-helix transcriptional regulator n=1 Tax=Paenibacillus residui TaxID=629724 RepID=A0ABW3DA86_9BACL|nr:MULTISPECIES: AraC family transcriptional regulator [Paenibacillaceae]SHE14996.1 Arabinose operon regulatory protein [Chlamydia abortus]